MTGLVYNELEKIFKRKRFLLAAVLVLLFSGVLIFGVQYSAKNMEKYEAPVNAKANIERRIKSLESQLKDPKLKDKERKDIQTWIAESKDRLKEIQKKIDAGPDSWKEDYKRDIEGLEKNPEINKDEIKGEENIYSFKSLKEKEYMLEKGIRPEEPYKLNAFNAAQQVVIILSLLFIPMLAILLGADSVSAEFQPATIKMMLIRPVSKWKILLSKYIALVISTVLLVVVGIGATFLMCGVVFGWGGWEYPVGVGAKYTFENAIQQGSEIVVPLLKAASLHIIPRWEFALYSTGFIIIANIVMATLAFAVSSVIRNSGIAMAFSLMSGAGTFFAARVFGLKNVMIANFMNYVNIEPLWDGSYAMMTQKPYINTGFGFLVLGVWLVAALAVSFTVFTKREVMV